MGLRSGTRKQHLIPSTRNEQHKIFYALLQDKLGKLYNKCILSCVVTKKRKYRHLVLSHWHYANCYIEFCKGVRIDDTIIALEGWVDYEKIELIWKLSKELLENKFRTSKILWRNLAVNAFRTHQNDVSQRRLLQSSLWTATNVAVNCKW